MLSQLQKCLLLFMLFYFFCNYLISLLNRTKYYTLSLHLLLFLINLLAIMLLLISITQYLIIKLLIKTRNRLFNHRPCHLQISFKLALKYVGLLMGSFNCRDHLFRSLIFWYHLLQKYLEVIITHSKCLPSFSCSYR